MKKWIISLTLMKVMPVLDANGKEQFSLQNEVAIISEEDQKTAYSKCAELAKIKHPGHNIVNRVIIDLDEALAETLED